MFASTFTRCCIRYQHLSAYFHSSAVNFGSALFVTGQRASETYSFLTPHLDVEEKFQDIDKLKQNIEARGLNIDVDKLKKSWDFLNSVKETKSQLEKRREDTSKKIRSLSSEKSEKSESEIKTLKILGKLLRDNLKTITKEVWDLEESVVLRILSLPNDLHPRTPLLGTEELVAEVEVKPTCEPSLSNLEIGQRIGAIKFVSPNCYYLEHAAAKYELALLQYCSQHLQQQGFLHSSNTDFCKSIILEGCGNKHTDPNSVFILQSTDESSNEDARLHLVGAASFPSFCALFTKQETLLDEPLKLCSIGRHYSPAEENSMPSLLNVAQESSVELFVACENNETTLMDAHNHVLSVIVQAYKAFGFHFRIVQCCSKQLEMHESLRTSLQMFSCHLQSYVEVGHVSIVGTYVSKRLLMKYRAADGGRDFLGVVSGRMFSVPKLLACVVEDKGALELPRNLEQFV